jgi:transcriptional regulator with XRE-family HTH domain
MNLGKAIKLCRVQKNLRQAELAAESGISVSYLSLLEKGKRDPNFSILQSIANALDIPASIIVFLGAEQAELSGISSELQEKLSFTALKLMGENPDATSAISQ